LQEQIKDENKIDDIFNIYGVNITKLLENMSQDIELTRYLLKTFYIDFKDIRAVFNRLENDNQGFVKYIHTLKGISGNLIMSKLHEECVSLESIIKKKSRS